MPIKLMLTNLMPTNLKKGCVELSVLALLFGTSTLIAAPIADNRSPYRLNVEPAKTLESINPALSVRPNHAPQMYLLQYKYRSHSKPALTTKAEIITEPITGQTAEQTTTQASAQPPIQSAIQPAAQAPTMEPLNNSNAEAKLADKPFSNEISLAAHATSLDPALIHAVIYVESRYQHSAISPKGAVGLMQVLPDTAARYGIRNAVYLPKGNIKAGTLYLRDLMVMFDNRLDLALAAYNAGEGAVKKYARQIPPYPETRHYVKAVMAKYALNTGSTGSTERSVIDNTRQPANHNIQETPLLPLTPIRTKYLNGTDLVISSDAFTLKR